MSTDHPHDTTYLPTKLRQWDGACSVEVSQEVCIAVAAGIQQARPRRARDARAVADTRCRIRRLDGLRRGDRSARVLMG
jgi:hypothetical protein